ncbi:MAG: flagellar basal body P-ring formation chaperone FlgA [Pseudomonadota bacterium]
MSLSIKTETEKKRTLLPHFRANTVMLFSIGWSVFSFFFTSLAVAAPDRVAIQVRECAQVDGNDISLKDIAEITAPPVLKEKIGAIRLGLSPKPGNEKKMAGRQLVSMAQAVHVMPEDAKMTVPESIRIQRAFQSIQIEVLQQLYEQSIRDGLDGALNGADVKVRPVKVCGTNRFPTGKLSFSVSKNLKKELAGNVNLRVQVRVNGKDCGRLTLSGWVDRFSPVVCAIRDVKHHTVLTAEDLTVKTVNVSTLSGELVTDLAVAVGKQTRTTLRAGACLRSGMLTAQPLVQRGDRVKIMAGSEKLSVSTMGIAKGSGGKGDQIQVENIVSNKTVVGRVTGEATVEVMF